MRPPGFPVLRPCADWPPPRGPTGRRLSSFACSALNSPISPQGDPWGSTLEGRGMRTPCGEVPLGSGHGKDTEGTHVISKFKFSREFVSCSLRLWGSTHWSPSGMSKLHRSLCCPSPAAVELWSQHPGPAPESGSWVAAALCLESRSPGPQTSGSGLTMGRLSRGEVVAMFPGHCPALGLSLLTCI